MKWQSLFIISVIFQSCFGNICLKCCESTDNELALECCKNPSLEKCSSQPCCEGLGIENAKWYRCLAFPECGLVDKKMCAVVRGMEYPSQNFTCTEACCESMDTWNTWSADVKATAGGEDKDVRIVLDGVELVNTFFGSKENRTLNEVIVEVPTGWTLTEVVRVPLLPAPRCNLIQKGIFSTKVECEMKEWNGRLYVVINVLRVVNRMFAIEIGTFYPPAGRASSIGITNIYYKYAGNSDVFASNLRVEPVSEGKITAGLFNPLELFPSNTGRAVLKFHTTGVIPKFGMIEIKFSSKWKFLELANWDIVSSDGASERTISTLLGDGPYIWNITVPIQIERGWVILRVSDVKTPRKTDQSMIVLQTYTNRGLRIDHGTALSSPIIDFSNSPSGTSPYNIVSLVVFLIAIVFCIVVTNINGIAFSKDTLWTDLTAICAILGLLVNICNNCIWLVAPSFLYYYLARLRLVILFIMILAVGFHWATVSLSFLRNIPFYRTTTCFAFIVVLFAGLQVLLLGNHGEHIELVYTKEAQTETSLFVHSCKHTKFNMKEAYIMSDIQPMYWTCYTEFSSTSPTHYYDVVTYAIFSLLTLAVMVLGLLVLRRGKQLLNGLQESQQLLLRQALRLYHTLIGIVSSVFIVAWVMQILGVFVHVDNAWWYIFVIWLPHTVPPCCFVFLQWNSAASTIRDVHQNGAEEIVEVRTPSLAFSSFGEWEAPPTKLLSKHDKKPSLTRAASAGITTTSMGISIKYVSTSNEVHACYVEISIEKDKEFRQQEDTDIAELVDTDIGPYVYSFLAVPQIVLPILESARVRFRVFEYIELNTPDPLDSLSEESLLMRLSGTHGVLDDEVNREDIENALFDVPSESDTESARYSSLESSNDPAYRLLHEFVTPAESLLQSYDVNEPLSLSKDLLNGVNAKLLVEPVSSREITNPSLRVISRQYFIQNPGLVVVEDLTESSFSNDIPRQALEIVIRQRIRQHLQAAQDLARFDEFHDTNVKASKGGMYETLLDQISDEDERKRCREWLLQRVDQIDKYVSMLRAQRRTYVTREHAGDYFKASSDKKNAELRMLPINLHVQELWVRTSKTMQTYIEPSLEKESRVYDTVTVGAMAAHCYKFKNGGMMSLQSQRLKIGLPPAAERKSPIWTDEERRCYDIDWKIQERMDTCLPQALATLVTSICKKLSLAILHVDSEFCNNWLRQLVAVGYVINLESLLSTQGTEIGMLEDMRMAVSELQYCTIKILEGNPQDNPVGFAGVESVQLITPDDRRMRSREDADSKWPTAWHASWKRENYQICIKVIGGNRVLPRALFETDSISVHPLLFNQGINEKQTLAQTTGSSFIQLQEVINVDSFKKLERIFDSYKQFQSSLTNNATSLHIHTISTKMDVLRDLVKSTGHRKKRPEILQISSDICRSLAFGRVTICKSAKDRTGMSVTLEQGRLLVQHHHLPSSSLQEVVSVMRSTGVRLENAFKNTGRRVFAFNALQRSLLPEEYRCPPRTAGKNES